MLLTVLLITLAACGKDEDENVLKVASINPPMTEILEIAAPILEEEGIKLEIVSVSDNIQPNNAVDAGEVDANFFGHGLWMEMYNENSDGNLDRKSTRLNSSHVKISYAVFCL